MTPPPSSLIIGDVEMTDAQGALLTTLFTVCYSFALPLAGSLVRGGLKGDYRLATDSFIYSFLFLFLFLKILYIHVLKSGALDDCRKCSLDRRRTTSTVRRYWRRGAPSGQQPPLRRDTRKGTRTFACLARCTR